MALNLLTKEEREKQAKLAKLGYYVTWDYPRHARVYDPFGFSDEFWGRKSERDYLIDVAWDHYQQTKALHGSNDPAYPHPERETLSDPIDGWQPDFEHE